MVNKAVLEGLLFVVGDDGLSMEQIEDVLEINKNEAEKLVSSLKSDYEQEDRGLKLEILGNRLKVTTKLEHKEYYKKLLENPESNFLSQAALETLAIVAYNAPVTRLQVDNLRGVSSSQMIRKLVAKGFIKEVGKSSAPGRPNLYDVTSDFLDYFGMASISDLPSIDEFLSNDSDEDIESDLYTSKYREEINE